VFFRQKNSSPEGLLKKTGFSEEKVFFGVGQKISPVRSGLFNWSSWAAECCEAVSAIGYAGLK